MIPLMIDTLPYCTIISAEIEFSVEHFNQSRPFNFVPSSQKRSLRQNVQQVTLVIRPPIATLTHGCPAPIYFTEGSDSIY